MSTTTHRVHVRFADIDSVGHVNHTKYLTYFEDARIAWFNEVMGTKWDWDKHGLILARIEVDYLREVKLNDIVEIETKVSRIGNKSFDHAYQLFKVIDDKRILACKGVATLVSFDYVNNVSTPIPQAWLDKMVVA